MKNKLLSPMLKSFLVLASLTNIPAVFAEDNIIYKPHTIQDYKIPFENFEVAGIAHAPIDYDHQYTYFVDTDNNRIQQFLGQNLIRQWGTKGSDTGQFITPTGIDSATDGSVYVADSANNRIQQFTYNGTFIKQWGSHGSEAGQLNNPTAITVATDGSVYVVDSGNKD